MAGIIAEAGIVLELVRLAVFAWFSVAVRLVPEMVLVPSLVLGLAWALVPVLSLGSPSLLGLIPGVRFVVVLVDDIAAVRFEELQLRTAVPFGCPKIVPLMRAVPFGNSHIGWCSSLPCIDDGLG